MQSTSRRLNLGKAIVLLVDDNPQSLELLEEVLAGFKVQITMACRSAAAARETAAAAPFDLILIDGEMPGEDGISLTRHIRAQPETLNFTTPIIMMSANTPLDKVLRARDAGANMVIKKPVEPAVLLNRIERLACSSRQFVITESFCGPDRRFKNQLPPEGVAERRADAIALTATPERAMAQNEVDSLFE